MANTFGKLVRNAATTMAAQDWFKDSVTDMQKRDPKNIFKRFSAPQIGNMYLFVYDPKYKKTLPFYDMYPLVIPIEMYVDGFLGLNLHYLPPLSRSQLMGALDDIKNNDKYNDTTKLLISYELLKRYSGSKFIGHDACIKKYLFGHVRSSFNYVQPADWSKAILLPLQRWQVNPNKKYAGRPPY